VENLVTGADTALWVAWHRAMESKRPDALFRDPLAARMAGQRGEEVARRMNRGSATRGAWTTIVRTRLIDDLIEASVAEGCDRVVNLAAGYDTRPYRLTLPAGLRWIEVDAPAVLDRKSGLLEHEQPRCQVERLPADLTAAGARASVLKRALEGASRAVVLIEGLLVYLMEDMVRDLARALHAHESVVFWITDLASPLVRRTMKATAHLVSEDARWRFAPAEGIDFFEPLGWRPEDVRRVLNEAKRLKRLPWMLHLVAPLDRSPRRPWGSVVRYRRS
jgi:methyltransferase (TIGR00027 family)